MTRLLFLYLAAFTSLTSAAYFSQGWQPGKAVPTSRLRPAEQNLKQVPLDFAAAEKEKEKAVLPRKGIQATVQEALYYPLTNGPLAGLLSKAGINVTDAIERANAPGPGDLWDKRIPLITDENYEEMIEYEELTPEEEENRTWAIAISLPETSLVSKFVDDQFEGAYNTTMEAGNDLPNVRWARINYMNVTALTTKWVIWKAPYIVIARDRGRTLRFYRPSGIRLREFHEFLKEEAWKHTQPWKTKWAPGGSRAWILQYFAVALSKYHATFSKMPKWMILLITGVLSSFLIRLLHGGEEEKPKVVAASQVAQSAAVVKTNADVAAVPEDPKKDASKKNRAARRAGK